MGLVAGLPGGGAGGWRPRFGELCGQGRRWRACERLSRVAAMVEFTGSDPLAYVISLNLHRRHLSESQRAMIAARVATMKRGDNQHTEDASIEATSQDAAAEMLNVSRSAVQRAAKVQREAPDLVPAIERGEVSVSAAATTADARKEGYAFASSPHWSPVDTAQVLGVSRGIVDR